MFKTIHNRSCLLCIQQFLHNTRPFLKHEVLLDVAHQKQQWMLKEQPEWQAGIKFKGPPSIPMIMTLCSLKSSFTICYYHPKFNQKLLNGNAPCSNRAFYVNFQSASSASHIQKLLHHAMKCLTYLSYATRFKLQKPLHSRSLEF